MWHSTLAALFPAEAWPQSPSQNSLLSIYYQWAVSEIKSAEIPSLESGSTVYYSSVLFCFFLLHCAYHSFYMPKKIQRVR